MILLLRNDPSTGEFYETGVPGLLLEKKWCWLPHCPCVFSSEQSPLRAQGEEIEFTAIAEVWEIFPKTHNLGLFSPQIKNIWLLKIEQRF